jgi:hypothetical protein
MKLTREYLINLFSQFVAVYISEFNKCMVHLLEEKEQAKLLFTCIFT